MICKNCGNTMEENSVFCDKCGKRIDAEEVAETVETVTEETVEAKEENAVKDSANGENSVEAVAETQEQDTPEKRKKKKWIKWTAIAVIVALLGGVVAFAFPYIKTAFWRTVLSEEDYFKQVIETNISEYADSLAQAYTEELEMYKNGEAIYSEAEIEVGEVVKDAVRQYGNGSNIDWLESVTLSGESGYVDGKLYTSADFKLNDTDITGLNVIIDGKETFVDFPGVSDGALRTETTDSLTEFLSELYEIAPDEKVMKEILVRYVMYMAECVEEVEEETETVEAGDVSKKYLKMTAKIDEKIAVNAIEKVLTEAKTDEDIKKIIMDYCNTALINEDADAVYKAFQDDIDEVLNEMDEQEMSFAYDFIIWVDSKGSIVGMGADFEDGKIHFINVHSGKALGTVFEIKMPGFTVSFEGSGNEKSNKFNGDYVLNVMGMDIIDVKVKNVDCSLIKKNVFNGQVEIIPTAKAKSLLQTTDDDFAALLSDAKITLDFKSTEKYSEKVEISVLSGKDTLLFVKVNSQKQKGNLPDINSYVDYNDYGRVEQWTTGLFFNIIGKLQNAGVPMF